MNRTASALAHPNIAFIKYWGNRDPQITLPANGSISMNLAGLETRTKVSFDSAFEGDTLTLNGQPIEGEGLARVSRLLDRVRKLAQFDDYAQVISENNFPTGAGIASSASAFAALSLAASKAAGLDLDEAELSRLARTGSGSACRSIPGGFVEWFPGHDHQTSYAGSFAPPEHWALEDHVVVVSSQHKETGSLSGHALAHTSPLQQARLAYVEQRLETCRRAILDHDFSALAEVVELDSNLMHAVMMTSEPRLLYWQPETVLLMQSVEKWRREGLQVCYTIDAGPNVHLICPAAESPQLLAALKQLPGIQQVLSAEVGGPARLVEANVS